ncbi:hypothetical protein HUJ05_005343 [Dendroctonus ponderosae]|nr:hypothetical protein HUJ05_005343 [Dendroctonus ponderosae]
MDFSSGVGRLVALNESQEEDTSPRVLRFEQYEQIPREAFANGVHSTQQYYHGSLSRQAAQAKLLAAGTNGCAKAAAAFMLNKSRTTFSNAIAPSYMETVTRGLAHIFRGSLLDGLQAAHQVFDFLKNFANVIFSTLSSGLDEATTCRRALSRPQIKFGRSALASHMRTSSSLTICFDLSLKVVEYFHEIWLFWNPSNQLHKEHYLIFKRKQYWAMQKLLDDYFWEIQLDVTWATLLCLVFSVLKFLPKLPILNERFDYISQDLAYFHCTKPSSDPQHSTDTQFYLTFHPQCPDIDAQPSKDK